ncbi:MAG: VPLPA-CTERM sorting domain-containing protein, partial [Mangrovicoccus sp.]|nr:VPLPA-CTERM sorting domain-containing protein [Mangrovicoccus sp.]
QADTRGMPTQDAVYRTQDLNGDGDANDAGEASVWLDLTGLNAGSSPFEISFDGNVAYIADTAGGSPRVYRAEDLDGNGRVEASEVNEFVKSADFVFALSVEASQGDVYSYDFLVDALVRYSDLNGDQQVDMASERFTAFDAGAIVDGAVFDFAVQGDQALITVNSFDDDLLLHLSDLNADGDFMDLGEVTTLLQFSDQGTYPQRPRSVIFYDSSAATPVPLPASILLLSGAVGGLILSGRRKKAA